VVVGGEEAKKKKKMQNRIQEVAANCLSRRGIFPAIVWSLGMLTLTRMTFRGLWRIIRGLRGRRGAVTAQHATGFEERLLRFRTLRPLAPHESFVHSLISNCNFCRTVSISRITFNRLNMEDLRLALRLLMAHHPNLRCGVHARSKSGSDVEFFLHEFEFALEMATINVVPRGGDGERWRAEVQRCLEHRSRQFSHPDQLLFELSVITDWSPNNDEHEIVLSSSHVIIDGTSNFAFHSELMRMCSLVQQVKSSREQSSEEELVKANWRDAASGSSPLEEALKIDPRTGQHRNSWFWRLLPPWVGMLGEALHSVMGITVSSGDKHQYGLSALRELFAVRSTDKETTHAVVREAKSLGVTVHALMHAIYVDAHAEAFGLPCNTKLLITTPVRMGSVVSPVIPRTEIMDTALHGDHVVFTVGMPAMQDRIRQYATECHHLLHVNPSTKHPGAAFRYWHAASSFSAAFRKFWFLFYVLHDRSHSGRFANAIISNVGDLTKTVPVTFNNGGRIRSVHVFQTNRCFGAECFLLFATMGDGEMHLAWVFPEPLVPATTADRLVSGMMSRLQLVKDKWGTTA
jgi:hypothetical protein